MKLPITMLRRNFFNRLTNLISSLGILAVNKSVKEKKLIYTEYVRGFQFNGGKSLLPLMHKGDTLLLKREPENEYDEKAVALKWNNKKIGYLPAVENVSIATMLDQGIELSCSIVEIDKTADMWEAVKVGVWM